jgi:acetyl/propionyl-CoA carboxylase alpha subunit
MEKLTMAIAFSVDGETKEIAIVRRRPHLVLKIGERIYEVADETDPGSRHRLRINDETIEFAAACEGATCFVRLAGRTWRVALSKDARANDGDRDGPDEIRAPMPGVVVSIHHRPGDAVQRGDTIVTIESMKLQLALSAPRNGIVAALFKQANEAVDKNEVIASLASAAASG